MCFNLCPIKLTLFFFNFFKELVNVKQFMVKIWNFVSLLELYYNEHGTSLYISNVLKTIIWYYTIAGQCSKELVTGV